MRGTVSHTRHDGPSPVKILVTTYICVTSARVLTSEPWITLNPSDRQLLVVLATASSACHNFQVTEVQCCFKGTYHPTQPHMTIDTSLAHPCCCTGGSLCRNGWADTHRECLSKDGFKWGRTRNLTAWKTAAGNASLCCMQIWGRQGG